MAIGMRMLFFFDDEEVGQRIVFYLFLFIVLQRS